MNLLADDLAIGAPSDWSEYRRLVGVVQGLAMAEREILDLETKFQNED